MERRVLEVKEYSFDDSWDAIWKSLWSMRDTWQGVFREREDIVFLKRLAESLMPAHEVKSVLDSTCGVGSKAIVLAEMGYDVEASDASAEAVRIMQQFSKEEGLTIPCFQSRWDELSGKCSRTFDCVFNDAFDLIATRECLLASARGIHSVLKEGGMFIFPGAHQWFTEEEKEAVLDADWQALQRIEVGPSYERDGRRLTTVYVHDRTSDGIIVNAINLWEEKGRMHVDIVKDWIRCFKWTWKDYVDVLTRAGFSSVFSVKIDGAPERAPYIPNVALK